MYNDLKYWESQWGGSIISSHGSTMSYGVCRLISPRLHFTEVNLNQKLILWGTTLWYYGPWPDTFVCIYGHNTDRPDFFVDLQNHLHNFQGGTIIIGYNFNFVFNLDLYKVGEGRNISFKARNACLALMSTFDLTDFGERRIFSQKNLHGVPMSHMVSTVDYIFFFALPFNSIVMLVYTYPLALNLIIHL